MANYLSGLFGPQQQQMDPALAARMLNGQFCTIFELIAPPYRVSPGGAEKKRKPPRGKIVA